GQRDSRWYKASVWPVRSHRFSFSSSGQLAGWPHMTQRAANVSSEAASWKLSTSKLLTPHSEECQEIRTGKFLGHGKRRKPPWRELLVESGQALFPEPNAWIPGEQDKKPFASLGRQGL